MTSGEISLTSPWPKSHLTNPSRPVLWWSIQNQGNPDMVSSRPCYWYCPEPHCVSASQVPQQGWFYSHLGCTGHARRCSCDILWLDHRCVTPFACVVWRRGNQGRTAGRCGACSDGQAREIPPQVYLVYLYFSFGPGAVDDCSSPYFLQTAEEIQNPVHNEWMSFNNHLKKLVWSTLIGRIMTD
jgi:hypothetical protein